MDEPSQLENPPVPPLEMRELVGPTEIEAFDNTSGELVFPAFPSEAYASVLDFGCGCGRLARKLIQQNPRPQSYTGVDLHRGMIEWCQDNLESQARGFRFVHHDVHQPQFNPSGRSRVLPLPVPDASISLMIALSVFTHTFEDQTVHYLREAARGLRPGGVLLSTWFVIDKLDFPMLQDNQNTLFINEMAPWNAVIYDHGWLTDTAEQAGLTITQIKPPDIRGYQWELVMELSRRGLSPVQFPTDDAPRGTVHIPQGPSDPSAIRSHHRKT